MSLVAYESSDGSDDEEIKEVSSKSLAAKREEELSPEPKRTSLFTSLPPPKSSKKGNFNIEADEEPIDTRATLKTYSDNSGTPSVIQRNQVSHRSEMRDKTLAFLSQSREKSQSSSVKITIPALSTFESEEDEPSAKKLKTSAGKSGLFAMLPPPKNTQTKTTNRLLIPHTLSKKPTPSPSSSTTTIKRKQIPSKYLKAPADKKLDGTSKHEDSDEDDDVSDGVSFFSFDVGKSAVIPETTPAEPINYQAFIEPTRLDTYAPSYDYSETSTSSSWTAPETFVEAGPSTSSTMYMPSADYGVQYESQYSVPAQESAAVEPLISEKPPSLPREVIRELGRKGRALEEIDMIDVSADDQLPKNDEYLIKGLTEEQEYYLRRKKGAMPTSQQRRKHQITYLAFQAKERELELKNQWSQNRLTKRQTQSKYGF